MVEERVIKRGDIYYARLDNSVGSEEAIGRPVVIVSSNTGNITAPTVNGVFLTTQFRANSVSPEITGTRRRSWALCNQIVTLDKQRLGDKMCSLSTFEMVKVDEALRIALGLEEGKSVVDNSLLEEKEKEIESLEDEVLSLKVEGAFYQKAYEKALDQLASLRIETDLHKRSAPVKIEEVAEVEETEEDAPVEIEGLLNINTARFDDLRALGFSANICLNIIAGRPYTHKDDLRIVPGMTSMAFQMVQDKITVGDEVADPVSLRKEEPKKKKKVGESKALPSVKINSANYYELMSKLGIGEKTAKTIIQTRKKLGVFRSMDDIASVPRVGKQTMGKIQGRIDFE